MGLKDSLKNFLRKLPGLKSISLRFNELREDNIRLHKYLAVQKNEMMVDSFYLDATRRSLLNYMKNAEKKHKQMAIYTVVTGGYEELKEPAFIDPNCDYYCITDDKSIHSDFWNIIYVENTESLDSVRFQRRIKLLPYLWFENYEHSLYIDASILIRDSVWKWIDDNASELPMLVYEHPDRTCIYVEAEACKLLNKDNPEVIDKQMLRYKQEKFPSNYGLAWTAIIYRRHNDPSLKRMSNIWWNEIKNGSRRDQLSLNYACWKTDFHYQGCKEDSKKYFYWDYMHNSISYFE